MLNFKEALAKIKAFAFDVDGVFSAQMYLQPNNDMVRSLNVKDGFALRQAIVNGYKICIITGGWSESVRTYFNAVGVEEVYLKSHDKLKDLQEFQQKYGLEAEEILYMGDDLPDYEAMQYAGISACPSDAAEEIQSVSHYISHYPGGHGCVRDIIEQVLRLQGKWNFIENMKK